MNEANPPPSVAPPGDASEGKGRRDALHLVRWFAHHYDRPFTEGAVLQRLSGDPDLANTATLSRALAAIGLRSQPYYAKLKSLDPIVLPVVAFGENGQTLVVTEIDNSEDRAHWVETGELSAEGSGSISNLQARIRPTLMLVTMDEEAVAPAKRVRKPAHWFWKPVRANWQAWMQILLASLLVNAMGLALPLFIMNVYDKVVPNAAFVTLWTLAIGVGLALAFDFILRTLRNAYLVTVGRRVDLKVGSALYRQALDIGLIGRDGGAAGLAGRIREFESVRDFLSSVTFVSFFDLIFIGLFLGVLYMIVGQLAFVPMAAIPVVIILALIARGAVQSVTDAAVQLAGRRQTVLMESLLGIETVKTLNAEPMMQREWEDTIAATARTGAKAQFWSNLSINGTAFVQQFANVVVIVWGVYLIFEGEITIGALIAASILTGRALAPLSMIAQAVFRFQYVMKSLRALDEVMRIPTEHSATVRSNLTVQKGNIRIDKLTYTYPGTETPAIRDLSLEIRAGECVALLGRVGSGKTTLGRLINGLLVQETGSIQIDGFGLNQYDRAELRQGIGYLPQRADLFTGTLRENLLLGTPNATQAEIENALHVSGLAEFVARSPEGLDMPISENGSRLSGGQAQALALARIVLKKPKVMFLDEPTAAMDQEMERNVCARLLELNAAGTGLILCTHKQSVAAIANRYVVLDQGIKVVDGSKEDVLRRLTENERNKVQSV